LTSLEIVDQVTLLFGTRTAFATSTLEAQLSRPIEGQDLPTFLAFATTFTSAVTDLAAANQPVSAYAQLRFFAQATASQPIIAQALQLYVQSQPTLGLRTLAAAITFTTTHLSNHLGTADAGYAGSANQSPHEPPTSYAGASLSSSDCERIADIVARRMKHSSGPPNRDTNGSTRNNSTPTSTAYCYLHGFRNHAGSVCSKMKAANAATPGKFTQRMLNAKSPTDVVGGAT